MKKKKVGRLRYWGKGYMSEAPSNIASISPSHVKRVKGRDIQVFHFWVYDYEKEINLDQPPKKGLVKRLTGYLQALQDFFE